MFTIIVVIATLSFSNVQNNFKRIAHAAKKARPVNVWKHPMNRVAKMHHWSKGDVVAAWTILYDESRSTPRHINIMAYNDQSGCAGAAQFATWQQYYKFGGNPGSIRGQLVAFANYITQRYGNPTQALYFHETHGWY